MARAVQTHEWDQTSLIWATLANANRNEQKQPKPFTPADVHPFRKPEDFEVDDGPDWAAIAQIKKQHKTVKLNGSRREINSSGGSVS